MTDTVIPPRWPLEAELIPPPRAMSYPVPPNTDELETWRPGASDNFSISGLDVTSEKM